MRARQGISISISEGLRCSVRKGLTLDSSQRGKYDPGGREFSLGNGSGCGSDKLEKQRVSSGAVVHSRQRHRELSHLRAGIKGDSF